jgi:predicted choloylglycine hydrolase
MLILAEGTGGVAANEHPSAPAGIIASMSRKAISTYTLLLLTTISLACTSRVDETLNSQASAATTSAPQAKPFPYPVVTMSGDGEAIGTAHGERFGDLIRDLHEKYFQRYFRNDLQRMLALTAADRFETYLSQEHDAEVKALAKRSNVNARQMMLAQCFLDLSAATACSTVTLPADAAPDGVARFGRNLDFPSFDIADKESVVLAYRPTGKNAFVSVGWPGLIGVLSGMNEHGLCVSNMEVHRTMRLPDAMPYTLLYRTVLEKCRTTDEAIALVKATPRQSANNLMVMDAAGSRAVLEITPQGVNLRRGEAGKALFSTNHQRDQDCDTPGRCDRYDSLHNAAGSKFGQINVATIEGMLKAASQKQITMQSMIFEPANRVIYLSAGADAASKDFHRLDCKTLFASDAVALN